MEMRYPILSMNQFGLHTMFATFVITKADNSFELSAIFI